MTGAKHGHRQASPEPPYRSGPNCNDSCSDLFGSGDAELDIANYFPLGYSCVSKIVRAASQARAKEKEKT